MQLHEAVSEVSALADAALHTAVAQLSQANPPAHSAPVGSLFDIRLVARARIMQELAAEAAARSEAVLKLSRDYTAILHEMNGQIETTGTASSLPPCLPDRLVQTTPTSRVAIALRFAQRRRRQILSRVQGKWRSRRTPKCSSSALSTKTCARLHRPSTPRSRLLRSQRAPVQKPASALACAHSSDLRRVRPQETIRNELHAAVGATDERLAAVEAELPEALRGAAETRAVASAVVQLRIELEAAAAARLDESAAAFVEQVGCALAAPGRHCGLRPACARA